VGVSSTCRGNDITEHMYIIRIHVHYTHTCTLYVYMYIIRIRVHYTYTCTLYTYVYIIRIRVHYTYTCTLYVYMYIIRVHYTYTCTLYVYMYIIRIHVRKLFIYSPMCISLLTNNRDNGTTLMFLVMANEPRHVGL
jgi:hypothetical protein